jgi:hypothetical protein
MSRRELEPWPDERLVERVLAGDEIAFDVLFERHVADALWLAHGALGSWDEAHDAVGHAFAAARAYLAAPGDDVEFAPWLHTILANHCLSMIQARTPGPRRRERQENVVDLDAWRARRRLGVSLPLVPAAGLRESVLAACGIGTSAAAAGPPLLAGTVAKVAAVVVLAAGGAGAAVEVAGERGGERRAGDAAAMERAGAVDGAGATSPPFAMRPGTARGAGGQPRVEFEWRRTAARDHGRSRRDGPAARGPLARAPGGRDRPAGDGPAAFTGPAPAGHGPSGSALDGGLPTATARAPGGSPAAPGPRHPELSTPATPLATPGGGPKKIAEAVRGPVRTVLDRVVRRVAAPAAPAPARAPAAVPAPPGRARIGDDPGVATGKLETDVRALPPQGKRAPET